jgi:4-oxalocrotonate tautomerase
MNGSQGRVMLPNSGRKEEVPMPAIFVEMFEGRTVEQKQQLVEGITDVVVKALKVDPEVVSIRFMNVKREDMARGGKLFIHR